jgi:hypothetical protein
MAEPIVFVSHSGSRKTSSKGLQQLFRDVLRTLEAEKPRTTAQLAYVDDTGTKVSILHVFTDADVMDLHFQGAEEWSTVAYEFMDPGGWEICGTPSDAALQMMRQAATSACVALTVQSGYLGGFLRIQSP